MLLELWLFFFEVVAVVVEVAVAVAVVKEQFTLSHNLSDRSLITHKRCLNCIFFVLRSNADRVRQNLFL